MSELHPATRGFELAVEAYERGRPDYPPAAVQMLVERFDLRSGRTVLDLAAGTGKLTRLLVPSGATILAVEPIAEMRAALERQVPRVAVLEGTAERIPLGDGLVDAVTVASAFHWFDAAAALHEIHRVLRPGGGLALLWNRRDERDPLQGAIGAFIAPLAGDTPRRDARDWCDLFGQSGLFGSCDVLRFDHRQVLDQDRLVDRVLSISFVAAADADVRADVERRVRALADGPVALPYVTEVYLSNSLLLRASNKMSS